MYPFPSGVAFSVSGCSLSGKTSWLFRVLRHKDQMFTHPPEKVLYCYGMDQPFYAEMERELPFITFRHGLPTENDLQQLASQEHYNVVVLDDLMDRVTSSKEMEDLFCKCVHHLKLTVLYLNQNMYFQGKHSRTIGLNTHVLVLMKSPRDTTVIQTLSRQAFLGKSKFLMSAFKDATSSPYGYLVIDFSTTAVEDYRVRTCVFPGEDTIIYRNI